MDRTVSFARLALTQSANLLGLTPAIVGFAMARSLGLAVALRSMGLACLITCILASLSAAMAATYRQPTARLSGALLGPGGPRLVGAALAVALCGWFGVHMMALAQALPVLWQAPSWALPRAPWVFACAALSLAIVWRGNARIAGINGLQAPLLVLAVAWAAGERWAALTAPALWKEAHVDAPSVAMVVAAGLGDVVDLPAVLHRARSWQSAVAAACVSYGLVLPTLLMLGALLAMDAEAPSALAALASGGEGWRWLVCGLAISSACVGNAGLVYSGGLSLAAALGTAAGTRHRLAMALAAAAVSATPLAQQLPRLLDGLGIGTGAVGAALLGHFVLDRGRRRLAPAAPWTHARTGACTLGAGAGFFFFFGPGATSPAGALGAACGVSLLASVLAHGRRQVAQSSCRGGGE